MKKDGGKAKRENGLWMSTDNTILLLKTTNGQKNSSMGFNAAMKLTNEVWKYKKNSGSLRSEREEQRWMSHVYNKGQNWKGKAIVLESGDTNEDNGINRFLKGNNFPLESSNQGQMDSTLLTANNEVDKLAVNMKKLICPKKMT